MGLTKIKGSIVGNKVSSIAELTALTNVADKEKVYVGGYYADGDGGGGNFRFDSASADTADGGLTFGTGTGRWKRILKNNTYSVLDFGAVCDGVADDSVFIQAAIDALSSTERQECSIPYGVTCNVGDAKITIRDGRRLKNNGTLKRLSSSSSTDPVLVMTGNFTGYEGGQIISEKDSPNGVVALGHENTSETFNAQWWTFKNCTVEGVQSAGNIGIYMPSSQPFTGSVNYFGTLSDIQVRKADVGIELTEISNSHHFRNIDFFFMIDSCYRFYGVYGCNVFGGFTHSCTNGVTIVKLLDERAAYAHDSENNFFIGVGGEPGGASSKGYLIEAGGVRNHLDVNFNVGGGNTLNNDNNKITTMWATNHFFKAYKSAFGDIDAQELTLTGRITKSNNKEFGSTGTVGENTVLDLFTVSLADKLACIVEVHLTCQNGSLSRYETINKVFSLHRNGAATTNVLLSGATDGTALTSDSWDSLVPNKYSITTFNNGTSTTTTYQYEIKVRHTGTVPTVVILN